MHIDTAIEIAAPPDRVWSILCETAAYPDWNPIIRRFTGPLQVGAAATIGLAAGRLTIPVAIEVLVVDPARELRWIGPRHPTLRRLGSGEHYHIIDDLGQDAVRLRHGEIFTGRLVPRSWARAEATLLGAYHAFNRALKRRAEAP